MNIPEERRRLSQRAAAGPSASATDEHDWLAQTHRHSTSTGTSTSQTHDRDRSNHDPTSPLQPTFNPSSSPPTNNHLPPHHPSTLPLTISTTWSQEKESILRAPYTYLEAHPGKDLRTHLITAFNAWLRVPEPSLAIITKVVGMLHTASLLIDDVEDSSVLRRGVPVAHKIFGAAQTINSANYMYFCALKELAGLKGVPGGGGAGETAVGIYEEELLNLHRGQGMDLFWRDTLTCPSEDDYLEMVGNKTGGLFRLAVRLMCSESPSHNARPSTSSSSASNAGTANGDGHGSGKEGKTDYIPLVNTIGLLFQILDDYLNLASPVYTSHKGLCEDLTEGKFSFPIIHSIRSDPSNLTLINILKQRTEDEDVKRWAVGYMEGTTGSFAYTRRVLRGLNRRAVGLVGEVDEGVARRGGGAAVGEEEGLGEGKALGDGVRRILEGLAVEGQRGSRGGVGPGVISQVYVQPCPTAKIRDRRVIESSPRGLYYARVHSHRNTAQELPVSVIRPSSRAATASPRTLLASKVLTLRSPTEGYARRSAIPLDFEAESSSGACWQVKRERERECVCVCVDSHRAAITGSETSDEREKAGAKCACSSSGRERREGGKKLWRKERWNVIYMSLGYPALKPRRPHHEAEMDDDFVRRIANGGGLL
ncbi:geranylgeranyl pyrophosphate synthetase [Friedmanniomyces endolithicus]|nr:geranylgeranyl pyrophosphate synthetase [Friedmanniomyces endolithicus]